MAEDHGAPNPGNSPGPGLEVVERQRASGAEFVAGQGKNQMRCVAGAA